MVNLDFHCETHGDFEKLLLPFFQTHYPCPTCGKRSEQVWRKSPNLDATAASAWAGIYDDKHFKGQVFTDKSQYHQAIKNSGRFINEPGVRKDAQENERRYIAAEEKKLSDKIDKFVQERTIDELRAGLKVDAAIHEAQQRHDANAIRRLGGMASTDEAHDIIKHDQIVVNATGPKES